MDEAKGLVYLGLRRIEAHCELGYWLIPDARRQGLGTAAIRLVSRWELSDKRSWTCNGPTPLHYAFGASSAQQQGRATLKEDLLGAAGDEAIMPIGMVLSDGAAPGIASTATSPAETLWEAFEPDVEDRHTDGHQC